MEREKVDQIITILLKVFFSALFLLLCFTVIKFEAEKKPQEEINAILAEKEQKMIAKRLGRPVNRNLPDVWPPKMNKPYPSFDFLNHKGQAFSLETYKGKTIVVSYVDMSSLVSQAQAGAAVIGPFGVTTEIDKVEQTFADIVRANAKDGFTVPHRNIIQIMVLVYAQDGAQAGVVDAERWSAHFGYNDIENVIVAVPQQDLRDETMQDVMTGFQLIDKNQTLRVDSSGISPKHNVRMTLVPLLQKLASRE